MDKLKKLEINKLIRELEFIQADYEWKTEMIQEADVEFLGSINKIVDDHPDLKQLYDQKIIESQKEKILMAQEEKQVESVSHDKSIKMKNIYRSIVKKTHPDKVDDDELKSIYIESTKFYEDDDIVSLYKICDKIGIEYEVEEEDYQLISDRLKETKDKISFLENTFTWVWLNSDEKKKQEVLLSFLRLQIV